jgi:N-glycosylase/DNA lyase
MEIEYQLLEQSDWTELKRVSIGILDLEKTLLSGQCFNWHKIPESTKALSTDSSQSVFIGVLNRTVFGLRVRPTMNGDEGYFACEFCTWGKEKESLKDRDSHLKYLLAYFQFDLVDLEKQVDGWSKADKIMKTFCGSLVGLRVLKQEAFECFVSYICSQNNNYARIQQIVEKVSSLYGTCLGHVEFNDGTGIKRKAFYAFPTIEQLCQNADEGDFRVRCGLGYRARYLASSLKKLSAQGGNEWLNSLKGRPYEKVQSELCEFEGVGKKVADCIALFSLEVHNSIGIDTHVLQITKKYYPSSMDHSQSLTPKTYDKVSEFYRKKFGAYAGWAANILFSANRSLKMGQDSKASAIATEKSSIKISSAIKRSPRTSLSTSLVKTLKKIHK